MNLDILETIRQIKKQNQLKKAEVGKGNERKVHQQYKQQQKREKISLERSKSMQSYYTEKKKASPYLFRSINFCFPIGDIDLSPKIVQILRQRIFQHGGSVFNLRDQITDNRSRIYLVSPQVNKQRLLNTVKFQDIYYHCLDYHYVNDCIYNDSLLHQQKYWIEHLKDCAQQKQIEKTEDCLSTSSMSQQTSQLDFLDQKQTKRTETKQLLSQLIQIKSSLPDTIPDILELSSPINLQSSGRIRKQEYWNGKKDKFLCQQGSSCQNSLEFKENNQMIIEELKKLQRIYEIDKDKGRTIAYTRAITAIKALSYDITSVQDVDGIHNIGEKLKGKIKQLLETKKLRKVQNLEKNQKYSAAKQLERVWGIGTSTALDLYNRGIKTIEQLKKNEDLLNKNQKLGLKYLQGLEQRIPRQQVGEVQQIVKEALYDLVDSRNLHKIQACGSYRREKQTCGDIDIIITRIDGVFQRDILIKLVERLQSIGLITDNLTTPKQNKQKQSCLNYMGICQIQGKPHRRIDIKYYHYQEFAFALLHFTGSDLFNRSLRLFARKKGFSLSDHRLIPVAPKANKQKWQGNKIVCFEERDIFNFLGIDYKQPRDRDIK